MKAIKQVLFCLALISGVSTLAQASDVLNCYDRTQLPPHGVNVARLYTIGGMVLGVEKPIKSRDGSQTIPPGTAVSFANRAVFNDIIDAGCFDGTDMTVTEDDSKSDALRLVISVVCFKDPQFPVFEFSLQCQ